jgi:hypothetical protein
MKTASQFLQSSHGGHSVQVDMTMLKDDICLVISQMGPDFVLLKNPIDHPPSAVTLIMRIDNSERYWNVLLPDGISANKERVQIAREA